MDQAESKFLHRLVLDGRGGARPIEDPEAGQWQPDDGVLWIHLDVNNPAARDWLSEQTDIPDIVTDALLAGESRPWTMATNDSLVANLRGVNTNPGSDPEDMVSVRIWIDRNRAISSRRRRLLSVVDIVRSLQDGNGPTDASDLFAWLVERLSDRIGEFVDSIEERVDACEDRIESGDRAEVRRELGEVRRQIAAVRRFLAPQRDALDRMNRRQSPVFKDEDAMALMQEADRVTRYLEDLDLARERVVVLQEEILSQMAQEQNTRMYVLSVVAAIFLPLTFITGLLGMNVGGLPGLENPRGFALSVIIMVIAGALSLVYFRYKKWL
jgi:zinc transporter